MDNPPNCVIFTTTASPKGFPVGLDGNSALVIQQNPGMEYSSQLAFGFGSDKIAIRRKYGSAKWTDWKYGTLS